MHMATTTTSQPVEAAIRLHQSLCFEEPSFGEEDAGVCWETILLSEMIRPPQ